MDYIKTIIMVLTIIGVMTANIFAIAAYKNTQAILAHKKEFTRPYNMNTSAMSCKCWCRERNQQR